MKWLVPVLVLITMVVLLVGMPYPLYYVQQPIKVTVVDDETGKPIEGAVVVARWVMSGGWYNTHAVGAVGVQEGVSDENGNVTLPGFEKNWRRWFSGNFFSFRQPGIVVYKYRYGGERYTNRQAPDRLLDDSHPAEIHWWGDEILRLVKLPEDPAARFEEFRANLSNPVLHQVPSPAFGCSWTKVKHLIIEYDKQMREAEELGLFRAPFGAWYMPPSDTKDEGECPGGIDWIEAQRAIDLQ